MKFTLLYVSYRNRYYYSKLDSFKKKEYDKLYYGLKHRHKSIKMRIDTVSEILDLVHAVYNDNPDMYYFTLHANDTRIYDDGYIYNPIYIYSENEVALNDIKIDLCISKFKRRYIRDDMTDFQKEKAIRDYLYRTVKYDEKNHLHDNDQYTVVGTLLNGRGVCWGISSAFKILCDACNIESLIVSGDAFDFKDNTLHAWNMAKIEGEFYHLDVTNDIVNKDVYPGLYEYFNVSDKYMKRTHKWDPLMYPTCVATKYDYFNYYGLYVKSIHEVKPLVKKKLKQGNKYITFKFVNNMPLDKVISKEILKGFLSAFCFPIYYIDISRMTNTVRIRAL